jgi:hypothetical protein
VHVAILGLGPSVHEFLGITRRLGGSSKYCDEVWGINAIGDVIRCDRIFHMDDVRIQELRAAENPEGNIAAMLAWMRKHPGPIVTSRPHPDYPGLVPFPLQDLLNLEPYGYFNSTAAYAVAYAVWHPEVTKISLFGFDFTYPNAHHAEKGRACVEFWLGIAAARRMEIAMPRNTSLMDALVPPAERFYGYDTVDVQIDRGADGIRVELAPRDALPTAQEMEARYDHNVHPNRLVESDR